LKSAITANPPIRPNGAPSAAGKADFFWLA
jgi:hypothetical protein